MGYTKEDVLRIAKEKDVKFIRLQFTDIFGQLKNVVIAYEPIWAIGTGKTATADQADEAA